MEAEAAEALAALLEARNETQVLEAERKAVE